MIEVNAMLANEPTGRLPRSLRKYLRRRKATLRRELPPQEAKQAIRQLLRGFRSRV